MRQYDLKRLLAKSAIVLLLIAVAGLSVAARYSPYVHKSSLLRFCASVTRVEADHLPVLLIPARVPLTTTIVTPEPEFRCSLLSTYRKIDLPQIGLTLSLQHRSPPSFLA
jgi:hypothetical protein